MKMIAEDAQRAVELSLGKKHIRKRIAKAIRENPDLEEMVQYGVSLLQEWLQGTYYQSKQKRLASLADANLELIVRETFQTVAFCQTPELFTSVVGMLSGALNFPEKIDNIRTAAEILAVLCNTDVYDIIKPSRDASLQVKANFPLPEALIDSILRSKYLPPMLCPPRKYRQNFASPYLTIDKDILVLGKGNGHTGDLCLDVLNIQNNIELRLDKDFLTALEEKAPKDPKAHNIQDWEQFFKQSREIYALILNHGGTCYLPNKVDKRGRMYSLGYHVATQGYSYKKAMLELANEEIVEGAPK